MTQQLPSCWKTHRYSQKCFSESRWWWGKTLVTLACGSNSASVHSWTWAGVATYKWSLLETFINHLICRSKIMNFSWSFSRNN